MEHKQFPLSLALALPLALALGMTAGCAGDSAPPADPGTPASHATPATGHHVDAHAPDAVHDHGHGGTQALGTVVSVPDNHEPWAPDAPLVEGMSRVREAIAALEGRPDAATVAARTADVDAAIEYMLAHCSLPAEPDIALHAILARLMAGSSALKENPADHAAVVDMHGAVENYEQLFDDPDTAS